MNVVRSSKRRKELVAIAARLFCERGYQRTTVRELAAAMGLQSGSLFHHFADKQEILRAVLEDGMEHAIATVAAALVGQREPGARLHALFLGHLRVLYGEHRSAHLLSLHDWDSLDVEARRALVALRDRYERLWQEVFDDAAGAGLIPADDIPMRRRLALGALNWTLQWYREGGAADLDRLAADCLGFVLNRPVAEVARGL